MSLKLWQLSFLIFIASCSSGKQTPSNFREIVSQREVNSVYVHILSGMINCWHLPLINPRDQVVRVESLSSIFLSTSSKRLQPVENNKPFIFARMYEKTHKAEIFIKEENATKFEIYIHRDARKETRITLSGNIPLNNPYRMNAELLGWINKKITDCRK